MARRIVSSLVLSILVSLPAPRQLLRADETPADAGFAEVIDVDVVNVEVYVTDREGRPVDGLEADDFQIFEDGRPVETTNFFHAASTGSSAAEGVTTGGIDPTPADPPALPTRRETAPPLDEQRLLVAIYVDNVSLHATTRNRTFAHLRSFLVRRLGPDDQVLIVSNDRGLQPRLPLTTDKSRALDVLYEIESSIGHAHQADRLREGILAEIYEKDEDDDVQDVSGRVAAHVESLFNEAQASLDALKSFVDSLAGLPGRKAVIYVSDGLPMRAGEDLFHALEAKFADGTVLAQIPRYDLTSRWSSITQQANSHRTTFYTLDTVGLRTHSNADVTNIHPGRSTLVESLHLDNLHDSLLHLANETGGLAIRNTNRFDKLLDRFGDDFTSYYSLGFRPATDDLGRYKTIAVKLRDHKGLNVRHRRGYRVQSLDARMSEGTLAALNFGVTSNGLGADVALGPSSPQRGDAYLVPVEIRVPMKELGFIERENVHVARIRLYVAVKDAQGQVAPTQEVTVAIEIPRERMDRARESSYLIQHSLLMAPGNQRVAIGLRDQFGAKTSFLLTDARIGP